MIFLIVTICFLGSCFTASQKIQYYSNGMEKLKKKYSVNVDYSFNFNAADAKKLSDKKLTRQTKSEINRALSFSEKIFALIPDSAVEKNNNTIDSFYFNKTKIAFIKKNNLITANIYCIEK
jgi:hypothetical protein